MVMEILKLVPEVEMVIQSVLNTGFQSMKSATLAIDTVEGKTTQHPAHSKASHVGVITSNVSLQ